MIKKIKDLFRHGGFIRYLKNTSWVLGERILRIFVALFIGVWVARYLGPENFGILSYAQSFVAIFSAFSSLGLNNVLVRELVKTPENRNVFLGTSFGLQTVGSTILMLCLIVSIYLNDNEALTNQIIIILGLLTFLKSFGVITSYFQSVVKSRFVVIPSIISLGISSILKVVLILKGFPLIYFVYVLVFDIVFITSGQIFNYFKNGYSVLKWKFSWGKAKYLLRDSWPLILSSIMISIYMKIDQVMIKELMDNDSVGQYAAAVKLSQAWYFVPSVICASLFPAIVNAKMKSAQLYKTRLQKLYNLMVLLAFSLVIPTMLFSEWLVDLTYGPEYQLTAKVLSVHVLAGVFVFLGVSNSKWLLNENLQKYGTLCLSLGMITNVVLNFVLIPEIGIIGAAYATLISQFTSTLIGPLLFKKTRPSFFMMIKSLFFIDVLRKRG